MAAFGAGESILKIAATEHVDPTTVSKWLHRAGADVYPGRHFVKQPPLKIPKELVEVLAEGPARVVELVRERIWGVQVSEHGDARVEKFCRFVGLYKQGKGVEEIAREIGIHRSSVAEWREGTDLPYLVKLAMVAARNTAREGWKWLPLQVSSGGSKQKGWILVPTAICDFAEIVRVLDQLRPDSAFFGREAVLGVGKERPDLVKLDTFAYLLGIMLGDASKLGGVQKCYNSMTLDLQLSEKEPTNEALGEFVALCVNSLGLTMHRIADKKPTGDTALAEKPTPAYRWTSSRSPLVAWMFNVCMGLLPGQLTSVDPVRMDWILSAPARFRTRFIQGVADSDGTARRYVVEIASMPNAEFITKVLATLGANNARTMLEAGIPKRTCIPNVEAAKLPIFSEFVKSYRYELLMENADKVDGKKAGPSHAG